MDYHRYLLALSAAVFSTEHRRVTARNLLATELKNADVTAGREFVLWSGLFANGSVHKLPADFPVKLNHSQNLLTILWKIFNLTM